MFQKYANPHIWKVVLVRDDGSMAYFNTSNLLTADLKLLTSGVSPKSLIVGGMGISEPLEFHLMSIVRFFEADFWTNENQHDGICPSIMHRNASLIKQNLLEALKEYPSSYSIMSTPSGK